MKRQILKCENCDDEIEECDRCGYSFEEGDDVICYPGAQDYHFCSEDCLNEYLDEIIVSSIVVSYDEDE